MSDKPEPRPEQRSAEVGSGIDPDNAAESSSPDAEFSAEEVTLPVDTPGCLAALIVIGELIGRIVGALLCIAGVVLIILGFSGNVTWKFIGAGISSSVQTGSLGVVVLIAGVLVVILCRPKITVTK